jgi:membrane-associated phospholipid phosphatase/8-oxo-dGTP pyrophosphatase MutT (NUDIX family)
LGLTKRASRHLISPVAIQVVAAILSFVGSQSASADVSAVQNPPPSSAGCFLVAQDPEGRRRLLMVRDTWSRRLSLPGGGRQTHETPEQAALRELKEETGIQAEVGSPSGDAHQNKGSRFALFHCIVSGVVLARRDQSPENPSGSWASLIPNSAKDEISIVLWVDPAALSERHWRFPSQRSQILEVWNKESPGPTLRLQQLEGASRLGETWPNRWIEREAKWIKELQNASAPYLPTSLWRIFSAMGEIPFFIFALSFLALFWPVARLRHLFFVIVIGAWINGLLKSWFGFPRPYELLPEVQIFGANGFGFPSGHMQAAMGFWSVVALYLWRDRRSFPLLFSCIFFSIGTGLSRIFGGVHSFFDVLGGAGFGLGVVLLFDRQWIRDFIESHQGATLFLVIVLIGFVSRAHPESVAIALCLAGYLIGRVLSLKVLKLEWSQAYLSLAGGGLRRGLDWKTSILSIGLLLCVLILGFYFTPLERTFPAMLLVHVFQYLSIGAIVGGLWTRDLSQR